jgi:hypothetical protein
VFGKLCCWNVWIVCYILWSEHICGCFTCTFQYRLWTGSFKPSLQHFQLCCVGHSLGILFFSIFCSETNWTLYFLLKRQITLYWLFYFRSFHFVKHNCFVFNANITVSAWNAFQMFCLINITWHYHLPTSKDNNHFLFVLFVHRKKSKSQTQYFILFNICLSVWLDIALC